MNNVLKFNEDDYKKRLLIVEDDEILVDIIKNYATNYFDEIYSFESTEKALLFLRNKNIQFDLSLIDYFLPGSNGDTIINELKDSSIGNLYLMSGDLEKAKSSEGSLNFNGHLQKPLSIEKLNNLFKESLNI